MTGRVGTAEIARMTGFSRRKVQLLAEHGKIPSAARLAGGCWTFDPAKVRAWIKDGEGQCQNIFTAEARPGGREYRSPAKTIGEAYERLFAPKRARG